MSIASASPLCLFDVDGTLVHVAEEVAFTAALREVCGDTVDVTYDVSMTVSDTAFTETVLRRHLGRPPEVADVQAALDRFVEILRDLVGSNQLTVRPVRGAIAFVEKAAAHRAVALSTGCVEGSARLKLQRIGLDVHFACGGFSLGESSRAQIVRRAIAAAEQHHGREFAPDQVVLFGDGPWDLESARATGVRFVGINEDPAGRAALVAAGAPHVLPDFDDCEQIEALLRSRGEP